LAVKDLELSDDGMCFGCGRHNPIGMKLEFEFENGEYVAEFTPKAEHQGWKGITHGGILATLVDEVMGNLAWNSGHSAVTAEMTVRYKRPAHTGECLRIAGTISSVEGRLVSCKAEIRNLEGTVIVEAAAKMVIVNERRNFGC
jgi:uncharacterized protein (TIGR00369 family)